MTAYAIIVGGIVANIAEADEAFAQENGWIPAQGAGIGDLWDGESFTKPEPVVVVPQVVTRRQAKQALLLATDGLGTTLLSKVQPAIDAIQDQTQRALIQIEWDESLDFERTRPSLIAMATAIGLDSAGIDALFITAATL
jgi:hypothetical protein